MTEEEQIVEDVANRMLGRRKCEAFDRFGRLVGVQWVDRDATQCVWTFNKPTEVNSIWVDGKTQWHGVTTVSVGVGDRITFNLAIAVL